MQYKAWEWAGKFQEVRNASKGPNYCKHFKDLYMEEINSGKLILDQSDWKWSWQGYHHCMWDKFGMYNIDPSKLVASMYGDPKDEDPEELALMKQEVEDIWNS